MPVSVKQFCTALASSHSQAVKTESTGAGIGDLRAEFERWSSPARNAKRFQKKGFASGNLSDSNLLVTNQARTTLHDSDSRLSHTVWSERERQ